MSVIAGQLLDLFDRRVVAGACQLGKAAAALLPDRRHRAGLARPRGHVRHPVSLGNGARVRNSDHALDPARHRADDAVAARDRGIRDAQQTAVICGPSIGGLLYGGIRARPRVYAVCTAIFVAASVLMALVTISRRASKRKPVSLETLFAGFALCADPSDPARRDFARSVCGAAGRRHRAAADLRPRYPGCRPLGARPAALGAGGRGALDVARADAACDRAACGYIMFGAVGMFGVASLVFALSTSIALSCLALAVYGAIDAVSVVIRQSLVQMRTPYDMLGRVMAVNSMFTGSSGTLGEFRAGAGRGLARRGSVGADRRAWHACGHGDLDARISAIAAGRQARALGTAQAYRHGRRRLTDLNPPRPTTRSTATSPRSGRPVGVPPGRRRDRMAGRVTPGKDALSAHCPRAAVLSPGNACSRAAF